MAKILQQAGVRDLLMGTKPLPVALWKLAYS